MPRFFRVLMFLHRAKNCPRYTRCTNISSQFPYQEQIEKDRFVRIVRGTRATYKTTKKKTGELWPTARDQQLYSTFSRAPYFSFSTLLVCNNIRLIIRSLLCVPCVCIYVCVCFVIAHSFFVIMIAVTVKHYFLSFSLSPSLLFIPFLHNM